MAGSLEERLREVERFDPSERLRKLLQRVDAIGQGLATRRPNLPTFSDNPPVVVTIRDRCTGSAVVGAGGIGSGALWTPRVEDPDDPSTEYTDYTYVEGLAGCSFTFGAIYRIMRIRLARAGWADVEAVLQSIVGQADNAKSTATRYTNVDPTRHAFTYYDMTNTGTSAAPAFGAFAATVSAAPVGRGGYGHVVLVNVLGYPTGGTWTLQWGEGTDANARRAFPWNVNATTLQSSLRSGTFTVGGVAHTLGTNDLTVVSLGPTPTADRSVLAILFYNAANPTASQFWGVDLSGKVSAHAQALTGPNPVRLEVWDPDWQPWSYTHGLVDGIDLGAGASSSGVFSFPSDQPFGRGKGMPLLLGGTSAAAKATVDQSFPTTCGTRHFVVADPLANYCDQAYAYWICRGVKRVQVLVYGSGSGLAGASVGWGSHVGTTDSTGTAVICVAEVSAGRSLAPQLLVGSDAAAVGWGGSGPNGTRYPEASTVSASYANADACSEAGNYSIQCPPDVVVWQCEDDLTRTIPAFAWTGDADWRGQARPECCQGADYATQGFLPRRIAYTARVVTPRDDVTLTGTALLSVDPYSCLAEWRDRQDCSIKVAKATVGGSDVFATALSYDVRITSGNNVYLTLHRLAGGSDGTYVCPTPCTGTTLQANQAQNWSTSAPWSTLADYCAILKLGTSPFNRFDFPPTGLFASASAPCDYHVDYTGVPLITYSSGSGCEGTNPYLGTTITLTGP